MMPADLGGNEDFGPLYGTSSQLEWNHRHQIRQMGNPWHLDLRGILLGRHLSRSCCRSWRSDAGSGEEDTHDAGEPGKARQSE